MPKLTTWTGRLTAEGEALADWLAAQQLPVPGTTDRPSLLNPAAVWFRQHPNEAAALWEQYQKSLVMGGAEQGRS